MDKVGRGEAIAPKRVLIADNNRDNRTALRSRLERIGGLHVDEASNGLDALELIRKRRPALVLMDMDMPVMNGYEAMRKIRASNDATASVPIIALTAAYMSRDIERCSRAGASDYLAKPVLDVDVLRAKVLFWSGLGHDGYVRPPRFSSL